tara:strand:- start:876 stop:1046 length:171 start_codon:yes stop_codon:yes gene_type:complete
MVAGIALYLKVYFQHSQTRKLCRLAAKWSKAFSDLVREGSSAASKSEVALPSIAIS